MDDAVAVSTSKSPAEVEADLALADIRPVAEPVESKGLTLFEILAEDTDLMPIAGYDYVA